MGTLSLFSTTGHTSRGGNRGAVTVTTNTNMLKYFLVSCVLALSGAAPQQGGREVEVTFIGDLTDTEHQVSGKVYVLDEDTLVIDQFSYDGNGFGVYINVATKGRNKKTWAKNRIMCHIPPELRASLSRPSMMVT